MPLRTAATKRILLVEDNPGDAELIQEILWEAHQTEHVVAWAESFRQAVEWTQTTPFDLVLLDLSLPDSHGLATLVNAREKMAHLPIVVLTGTKDETLGMETIQAGAQDYLLKGHIDSDILIRSLRYAITRHAMQERTKTILASITDAFLTLDRGWRFVSLNKEAERLMGRSCADLLGKNIWEVYPETVPTQWYREYHRAIRDNVSVAFEVYSEVSDRWSDVRAYPSSEGLSVYFRDVTERKQAEEKIRTSEENLNQAQALAHIGSWELDLRTRQGRWSKEMFRIYGIQPAPAPPSLEEALLYVHPEDRLKVGQHAASAAKEELEFRLLLSDGTIRYLHALSEVVQEEFDKPVCLRGIVMDITERKAAENALYESEERFRSAIHSMHEGLILQNREGEIIVHNQRAAEILGLTDDQLRGRTSLDPRWQAIHEDGTSWPGDTHPAMVALREGIEQHKILMGVHKPDGKLTWVSINAVPMFHEGEAQPYAAVVTFSDITERKWFDEQIELQITGVNEANVAMQAQQAALEQANAQLEALATTDGLTGLKNHRTFQEKLVEEYERARRYGITLSLLLLDVDHFKKFNDQFGHPVGDSVLKQVAALLQSAGRSSDFVARYGGEEFVIILPKTDSQGAQEYAERIRAAIASHVWEERDITVSVGVTTLHPATENSATLVTEADQALYLSKAAGRNRVTHFRAEAIARDGING